METQMALRITQKTGLVIVIIAFMTTMVRTESGVSGDIPDDVVYTDLHKTVHKGDSVVLTCRFRGTPLAVYWKKGDDPRTAPNLVSWIPTDNVTGLCEGVRPCQIMEMNEDRSLVIKEVSIGEKGRYICRVSSYRGILIHNFTDISVFSPPMEPFPVINECQMISPKNTKTACTTSTSHSVEISCTASGYYPEIDLYFLHGSTSLQTKDTIEVTNLDGTKNKTIYANATVSDISYVCFASNIPGLQEQRTATVLVNLAETPSPMPTGPIIPINKTNAFKVVIVIVPLCAFFAIILIILTAVYICRRRERNYKLLKSPQINEGPVSYLELWELVEMCDIVVLDDIVSKLVENPGRESEYEFVRSKADLYSELCEWKDKSTGDVGKLYAAIEENGHDLELQMIKGFRTRTDKMVSLDDLEHICWHVQGCKKTVKPVLRALYSRNENITKFPGDAQTSGNSRQDVIRDDLQLMKTWKEKSMTANPEEEGTTVDTRQPTSRGNLQTNQDAGDSNERTPMYSAGSEDVDLGAKILALNQMVRVCLALEEAGRRANESDKLVYHQLAKTFFRIQDKYKSELTDEVFKEFALSITEQHCQRLGNTLKLSADAIAKRNKEDLEMFRTDFMLKAWVLDQKCSNYEIRRRLRQAAEQCYRQDIADNFISKEQSEVVPLTTKLPACLTTTNEIQRPGDSASGSIDELGNGSSSQSLPHISNGDLEETQTSDAQPAANIAESEVGFVSVISHDELARIGRYAGLAVLLAFCRKYDVTDVPEQQSPEGKELPFETKIINVLKPKLDSEHEISTDEVGRNTPRKTLSQLLRKTYPRYACLLARRNPARDISNVELIDLAFRLIMSDVYPVAKALNISDQVLTPNRGNLGPHNLKQGTAKIMIQVTTNYRSKEVKTIVNTGHRFQIVKTLKQAGYSGEARAVYFGFEISFGDMIEVENRVDKAQLAKQLGVSDDVRLTGADNLGKDDTLHQSVLLRWRDTVHSSTFNHRFVLADALFRMDEEQLALDIISGVYRNRAIDNPVSELLAATIPETDMPTLSNVLGQKVKNGQKSQDVISTWVNEKKLTKFFSKSPTKLSNELLGAGFYAFAHEIMAGAWKEDKKVVQKEGTENGKAANEELHQEGVPINEQGEQEGKEKKEGTEKATSGATPGENTGKEGEKKDKEEVEGMEKATNDDTPVEHTGKEDETKEKSGDGAAESRENTTVNVDTNEQGNTPDGSDERKRDESSETPLLDNGKLDHWGDPIDNSRHKDPTAMSRYHDFI